jgi:DNA-binding transcriptional LysR family regulator
MGVQQCRAAGFEPDVRFELADLGAHVALIAAGRAVGMLPDLLFVGTRSPLALGALPGDPAREIFTATRRASAGRPGIQLVQEAIEEAFAPRGLTAGSAVGYSQTLGAGAFVEGERSPQPSR